MNAGEFLKEILLIFALTTDSFVVSFSYGMSRTIFPLSLMAAMNLIMSALLGAAVFAGNAMSEILPAVFTAAAGALLLSLIGGYRLVSFFRNKGRTKQVSEEELSKRTAVLLAFVLSADSLAAGIGTGLIQSAGPFLAVGTFFAGMVMMKTGWFLGYQGRQAAGRDLSWLGGLCLLALAASFLWVL